jgi:hypothetical protein
VKNGTTETGEEMLKIIKHGQTLMSEKASLILGMKDELRRTSDHYNKVTEM